MFYFRPQQNPRQAAIASEMKILERIDATQVFVVPTKGDYLDKHR